MNYDSVIKIDDLIIRQTTVKNNMCFTIIADKAGNINVNDDNVAINSLIQKCLLLAKSFYKSSFTLLNSVTNFIQVIKQSSTAISACLSRPLCLYVTTR